jgi:hypothetical protein
MVKMLQNAIEGGLTEPRHQSPAGKGNVAELEAMTQRRLSQMEDALYMLQKSTLESKMGGGLSVTPNKMDDYALEATRSMFHQ